MFAAFVLSMALAGAPSPLQGQPVPQPFPKPGSPPVQAPPARPAQPSSPATPPNASPTTLTPGTPGPPGTPGADGAPTESMLGLPLYPGLQFIASYDAWRDQRYYLFGSTRSLGDWVAYYRTM